MLALAALTGCPRAPPPSRAAAGLRLRGGVSAASEAEAEAALRAEYERYAAKVAMPLSNYEEADAQRTQAVRLRGLLSRADIEDVHRVGAALAARRQDSTIDRSAWGQPEGTWTVTFVNAGGALEAMEPALYAKIRDAALAVDRAHWNVTAGARHANYRVAEYHTMRSALGGRPTGGGLHTQKHVDQGSLVTIDILLSDPADIEGGVLQTLEADGALLPHAWEQGDALVFLSHKYHCVSRLTRGTRQVMVCELWQGTENLEPSRDEQLRWRGEWR